MSVKANDRIFSAFLAELQNFSPALPIASENREYSPVVGVPYMEVKHSPNEPLVATVGPNPFTRYEGLIEIILHYPLGEGWGTAKQVASLLILTFNRGRVLTQDGEDILIIKSWETRAYPTEWWNLPVFVRYRCYSQN